MGLNTYFISDLHLGANYLKQPHCNERRVVHFLDSIRHDVAELYLLGDILDYWYEYKYVVPRGYVRFFGKLAELADAGVKIYWLTGNHDVWLFDYLRDEIGMTVLKTCQQVTIGGKQFFISHGDDIGHQPRSYRFMRWCFYNRVCQMLYAAVHPRWTYAIATGWSADNRTHRNAQQQAACVERSADDLIQFSQHYATQHPAVTAFVYGHLHLARMATLEGGQQVVFLGDWINQCTYAVYDGSQLHLRRYLDDSITANKQKKCT